MVEAVRLARICRSAVSTVAGAVRKERVISRKLLVVLPDSSEVVLEEVAAPDEQTLHDRLRRTPGLLPVEAFGVDGPLLVVGQETSLASGRIDLVALTRTGDVLLIEFKTGPQNP